MEMDATLRNMGKMLGEWPMFSYSMEAAEMKAEARSIQRATFSGCLVRVSFYGRRGGGGFRGWIPKKSEKNGTLFFCSFFFFSFGFGDIYIYIIFKKAKKQVDTAILQPPLRFWVFPFNKKKEFGVLLVLGDTAICLWVFVET